MTEDILQAIRSKAQDYVIKRRMSSGSIDELKDIVAHNSYTSGCIEGIELMLGFFEILRGDFDEYSSGWECLSEVRCDKWGLQFEIIYGTEQLLSLYLKTLTNDR